MGSKKILVFGAAGFIAAYLIDELISLGHQVTATDIDPLGRHYYLNLSVQYIELDITDSSQFSRLGNSHFDVVIHLAACQPANVSEKNFDLKDYINVNIIGTLNILEYCRVHDIDSILYASSHRNTEGLWAKNSIIREVDGRAIKYHGEYSMFSISETAAQDCVHHYDEEHGVRGVILRLPPVYGYGPHTEIFKNGFPIKTGFQLFMEKASDGQPLEVWGDKNIGRDIIYVKDVVSAFLAALKSPNARGVYNISSSRRLTLIEQATTIADLFWGGEGPPVIVSVPEKQNDLESFCYDNQRAREELGWNPTYSFRDMLIDYVKEAKTGRFKYLVSKRQNMFHKLG